jgi:hypothetical protein
VVGVEPPLLLSTKQGVPTATDASIREDAERQDFRWLTSFALADLGTLLNDYCGSASGNHKHTVFLAHYLVININANHGVRAEILSTLLQFLKGDLPRTLKLFLVSCGPPPPPDPGFRQRGP